MSRMTRRSILPVNQVVPLTYRDGISLLEMIEDIAEYIKTQLHPSLQSVVDGVAAEAERLFDESHDRYVDGVEEFQRIHDAFMSDVNAHLVALNDGAVADLVNDDTSKLGRVLREIFPDRELFGQLSDDISHRVTIIRQDMESSADEIRKDNDRFQGVVNSRVDSATEIYPEHYGAIGDGVADDTVALQTWVAQGFTTLRPGSQYRVTESIVYDGEHMTLIGNGSTIYIDGDGTDTSVAVRVFGDWFTMDGVHIVGVGNDNYGGLRIEGNRSTITNNVIEHIHSRFRAECIRIHSDIGGHHIVGNVLRDTYTPGDSTLGDANGMSRGIIYHAPQDTLSESTLIADNTISDILGQEGDGIQLLMLNPETANIPRGYSRTVVNGNMVTNCSRRCIKIQASGTVVSNNVCREKPGNTKDHPSHVIDIIHSTGSHIFGNDIVFSQHLRGISVSGAAGGNVNYMLVEHNTVVTDRDVEKICIYVDRAIYSTFTNNHTVGGYRSINVGNATACDISSNVAHDVAGSAEIPSAIAFHATSSCRAVVMANNINMSWRNQNSFHNRSEDGVTVNNVEAR